MARHVPSAASGRSSPARRPARSPVAIEGLEDRRLFATQIVGGTPLDDVVVLDGLRVTINGNTFDLDSGADIEINTTEGRDKVTIKRTFAGNPVVINSGAGDDTVTLGGGRIDDLLGQVTVVDSGGTGDQLVVNDTQQTSNIRAVNLDQLAINGHAHGGIEKFAVNLGPGNSTFRLNGLQRGDSVVAKGNGGNDTFELGNGDIERSVFGNARFEGGAGVDLLHVVDAADQDGTRLVAGAAAITSFGEAAGDEKTFAFVTTEFLQFDMGGKNDDVDARAATLPIEMRLGGGNDVARGGSSLDTIFAGDGNDQVLDAGAGSDTIRGEGGNDTLFGGAGGDVIVGGPGDDVLGGGDGSDSMVGDAGNDSYRFGSAPVAETDFVTEVSGGGVDSLVFQNVTTAVTVNLGSDAALAVHKNRTVKTGDPGQSKFFDNAAGGSAADKLTGNAGANTLTGNGGNDLLAGLAGNDSLLGGTGDDTLDGGEGSDALDGGANNDTYKFAAAAATQTDTVTELTGGGTDALDFAALAATDPVTINLQSGTTTVATHARRTVKMKEAFQLPFIETLIGGKGNDKLTATLGRQRLVGNDGNDTLDGSDGTDDMFGGNGNDRFFAFDFSVDLLDGGAGTDSLGSSDANDTKISIP